MDRARAAFLNRRQMFRRAVAFVLRKTVFGKLRVELQHPPVARDLGQHARGGDGIAPRIALDDGRLRHSQRFHRPAVHERVRRQRRQLRQRVVHRAMRRLQNIDLVNHRRADLGDSKFDFAAAGDEGEKLFALRFGELLGIVQAGEFGGQTEFRPTRRQNRRRRNDRPGERPTPGLVHAGNARDARTPESLLEFKRVDELSIHNDNQMFSQYGPDRISLYAFNSFSKTSRCFINPSLLVVRSRICCFGG